MINGRVIHFDGQNIQNVSGSPRDTHSPWKQR